MDLERRVLLLKKLGGYLLSDDDRWQAARRQATAENPWFIEPFVTYQLEQIADHYLAEQPLREWIGRYPVPPHQSHPKTVGIIMAGNIPLAGFHDFLSVFVSGHRQTIKPSSKDAVLIRAIVAKLIEWEPACADYVMFSDILRQQDAYIATGSNNSGRYFDYYFSRYPHIIRRNRTSVAVLSDSDTVEDLSRLADDVYLYFGLGCRNVTKLFVPEQYDFLPLLEAFNRYAHLAEHHKYKNNYDYRLAVLMINRLYYMTNGSILLHENASPFSPISQLHYEYYRDAEALRQRLQNDADIQCIVGRGYVPFGQAQQPSLADYADRIDTLQFLLNL